MPPAAVDPRGLVVLHSVSEFIAVAAVGNASRRAVLVLLEGAAWGFELPQEGEPSAYLHHAPLFPPQ